VQFVATFSLSFLSFVSLISVSDVYILLWERNLDVVLVQRIVDGGQHLTFDNAATQGLNPDKELEVDAGVGQL
jgi:hypothetical protein